MERHKERERYSYTCKFTHIYVFKTAAYVRVPNTAYIGSLCTWTLVYTYILYIQESMSAPYIYISAPDVHRLVYISAPYVHRLVYI